MSDCEHLSDRMPDVALHRSAWARDEAAHLATCADCQAEWALVTAARRLEKRAPALDTIAITAGVQRRLATERAARRRHRWLWAAGSAAAAAAAAIAIAVGSGIEPATVTSPRVVAEVEPMVPLPELDGLETAQLDTLLQSLDGTLAGSASAEPATPSEEDAELEQILATWEG